MKFTKRQIISVMLLNLGISLFCVFNLIKWINVSNTRTAILLGSTVLFFLFALIVFIRHYKMLFDKK